MGLHVGCQLQHRVFDVADDLMSLFLQQLFQLFNAVLAQISDSAPKSRAVTSSSLCHKEDHCMCSPPEGSTMILPYQIKGRDQKPTGPEGNRCGLIHY